MNRENFKNHALDKELTKLEIIDNIYNDFEAKENELKTWLENKINSNIDFKEKVAFQEVLDIIIDIEKEQKRI